MKVDDYFEGFFPTLSELLTLQIARANGTLLREDFKAGQEFRPSPDRRSEDESVEPGDAESLDCLTLPEHSVMPDEHLAECRLNIRQHLYRYLAFLADSLPARRQKPLPAREILPPAMAHLLGIEDPRFAEMPRLLTVEFEEWLGEQPDRQYHAAWGQMLLLAESQILLSAERAERAERQRVYARDSFPARRASGSRKR